MNRRRTLWYLVPALSVGGTERTLVDLANGLNHDRYDVTVWTIFDQNALAGDLTTDVTHRTLGIEGIVPGDEGRVEAATHRTDYVRAPLRFAWAVHQERPDLVQSFLPYDNAMARVVGLASSETVIVSGVREVPTEPPLLDVVIDRLTMPLTNYVVSNSRAGADFAVGRGARQECVSVVPNGREVSTFADAEALDLAVLGLPKDATVVGTVGRLVVRKGHYDLLTAWPRVRSHHPDAHLLFVGDGPERGGLERRATALGVADTVHFLGVREDVPRLLATLDCFVFPSHYEGLPGAVIEAMAAGLPLVVTHTTGTGELVENYETGLYIDPRSPAELASATNRLLDFPTFATALGTTAQAVAKEQYTIGAMVDRFERFYDRIL